MLSVVRNCNADAGGLSIRTIQPPSDDWKDSRAKVGEGGCEIREYRRVEGGESNGGTSEVVGGGGCEIREFWRVEEGGSNFGTIEVVEEGGCEFFL